MVTEFKFLNSNPEGSLHTYEMTLKGAHGLYEVGCLQGFDECNSVFFETCMMSVYPRWLPIYTDIHIPDWDCHRSGVRPQIYGSFGP